MLSIKNKYSLLFFVVFLSFSCEGQIIRDKSERYYQMIMARDKAEDFQPFGIIKSSELKQELLLNKQELLRDFIEESSFVLKEITSDTIYKVLLDRVSSGKNYLPLSSSVNLFNNFEHYQTILNALEASTQKFINNDDDLIVVEFYSATIEYIFFREIFKYNDVFEPTHLVNTKSFINPMSQSVLFKSKKAIAFGEIIEDSVEYIGFSQNKYQFTLTLPVVYKNQYLCDARFIFLR
jgi:hypothetical protein